LKIIKQLKIVISILFSIVSMSLLTSLKL